jgi:mannosyltransferase
MTEVVSMGDPVRSRALSVDTLTAETGPSDRSGEHRVGWERFALPIAWVEAGLSALLGSIALGKHPFFYDESVSAAISTGSLRSIYRASRTAEPNMFGYHLLLHEWQLVFGSSEADLRSLSVVAMALTVVFVFAIGRRVFDARTGVVAGLLFATAPFIVHIAQDARSYAVLTLLVTAATYLLIIAVDRQNLTPWLAYAVVASLSVYAHFFGGLVILAQALSLVVLRRQLPWRMVRVAGAVMAVLLIPVALLLAVSRGGAQWSWMASTTPVTPHYVLTTVESLGSGPKLTLVLALVALVGLWYAWRIQRTERTSLRAWHMVMIVAWLVVPFMVALAFSVLVKPYFLDRYFVISLPPLILVVAFGITRLSWLPAVAGAVAVVLVLSVPYVLREYQNAPGWTGGWREAASLVVHDSKPGDGLAFCPGFDRNPFDYYGRQYPTRDSLTAVPGNAEYDPAQEVFYPSNPVVVPIGKLTRLWVVGSPPNSGWPESLQATVCGLAPESLGFHLVLDHVDGPAVRVRLFSRTTGP